MSKNTAGPDHAPSQTTDEEAKPGSFLEALKSWAAEDVRGSDDLEVLYPPLSDAFDGELRAACERNGEELPDGKAVHFHRLLSFARLRAAMSYARHDLATVTGRSPAILARQERDLALLLVALRGQVEGLGGSLSLMLQFGTEPIDLLEAEIKDILIDDSIQLLGNRLADTWAGTSLDRVEYTSDVIEVAPPYRGDM